MKYLTVQQQCAAENMLLVNWCIALKLLLTKVPGYICQGCRSIAHAADPMCTKG